MKGEELIRILIEAVFEQATRESGEQTAYGLSKYLHQEQGLAIGERNITRYYNFYIEGKQKEIIRPDKASLDILAQYSGYNNYKDYVDTAKKKSNEWKRKFEEEKVKNNKLRTLSFVGSSIFLSVLFVFILKYYEKNCMVWVEDHYEKTRCTGDVGQVSFNATLLEKLKKIIPCDTTIFIKNGREVIWYDKSDNELSFFTYPGIHPINRKPLKSITEKIIETHLTPLQPCSSNE